MNKFKYFGFKGVLFAFVSAAVFLSAFSAVEASHNLDECSGSSRSSFDDFDDFYDRANWDYSKFSDEEYGSDLDEDLDGGKLNLLFRIGLEYGDNFDLAPLCRRNDGKARVICNYNCLNFCFETLLNFAIYRLYGDLPGSRCLEDGKDYFLCYKHCNKGENRDFVYFCSKDGGKCSKDEEKMKKVFGEFYRLVACLSGCRHGSKNDFWYGLGKNDSDDGFKNSFRNFLDDYVVCKTELIFDSFDEIARDEEKYGSAAERDRSIVRRKNHLFDVVRTFARVLLGEQIDVKSVIKEFVEALAGRKRFDVGNAISIAGGIFSRFRGDHSNKGWLYERLGEMLEMFSGHVKSIKGCKDLFEID